MTDNSTSFYKSKDWERIRASILIRDKYRCKACEAGGRMVNAECVHHIFPYQFYPEYAKERWNLISLCNICHNEMHNRFTDELSKMGEQLLKTTAAKQGIRTVPKRETVLVIGLAGTGKTTYCKKNMDRFSIAYDLDALAAAFRLTDPHKDDNKAAHKMANDFMLGFIQKAHEYAPRIFVIRTAPTIKELEQIKPSKVVICRHEYVHREMNDRQLKREKIKAIEDYCRANDYAVEEI